MHFDVRAAKLLQPGEHLLVEGCNGLRLVASRSRRSWTYRYKDARGRMRQVGLGAWPAVPVQDAIARWGELVTLREADDDPAAAVRRQLAPAAAELQAVTVRQVVQAYIDGPLREGRASAGFEAARRSLERTLDEDAGFSALPVLDLRRAKAYAVIDARKATPTAAAKLRSLLGAAWEHAHDSGLVEDAPNWWREVLRGRLRSCCSGCPTCTRSARMRWWCTCGRPRAAQRYLGRGPSNCARRASCCGGRSPRRGPRMRGLTKPLICACHCSAGRAR